MVQPKLEILGISKAVGLTFKGLDLVHQPLDRTAGDVVLKIAKKACPIGCKRFADPFESLDAGTHSVLAPY